MTQSLSVRIAPCKCFATCCTHCRKKDLADLWDAVAVGRHASEPKTRTDSPTGIGIRFLLHSKHRNYLCLSMSMLFKIQWGRWENDTHMTSQSWCYNQLDHRHKHRSHSTMSMKTLTRRMFGEAICWLWHHIKSTGNGPVSRSKPLVSCCV